VSADVYDPVAGIFSFVVIGLPRAIGPAAAQHHGTNPPRRPADGTPFGVRLDRLRGARPCM
jgi:hypothetical protein